MSFTLMHYKDGKPAPIKVSVWDAFKGVPPPKARLHQCVSCNDFHVPAAKPHVKSQEGKQNAKNAKPEKKGDAEDSGFTKEEDAKITQMKADGKTWAEIAKEIGGERHKTDISRRFKEINAEDGADKPQGKESDGAKEKDAKKKEKDVQPDQSKMTKKEKKAAKAQHDREEGLKKKEEQKDKQEAEGKKGDGGSKDSTTENAEVKADTVATTSSKNSMLRSEKQKWMAAASKHFDRTGQRLTADQARKMAEGRST